ncbi:MAG TPA: rhodanese-like domain-containing protein [Planctomycetaceae bacterium]|nr:rhodanese-like domain-containing protein [Planctomycetaceae bacterium]
MRNPHNGTWSKAIAIAVLVGAAAGNSHGSSVQENADPKKQDATIDQVGKILSASACSVDATIVLHRDKGTVLIDVRRSPDREVTWIPGAVQLSLVEVSRSSFVDKTKQVVLIGDGKDAARLLAYCETQQRKGQHQYRVLTGGLPGWVRAGGVIAGDGPRALAPLRLDAQELHALLARKGARLILAGVASSSNADFSKHRIIETKEGALPGTTLARLSHDREKPESVVVFLPTDALIDQWRNAARALALADPLFFIGDLSQYDAYLKLQDSIAQGLEQSRTSMCEPE